ncbi:uncharacterized protein KQ657_000949 [Scheffersomyces spartinae]|uniref:Signal recognition particle receptor subunit alpha homolog n=1 Tax=Scheffersomyces spartinae TaxID=45513 RepID=A0A9P7V892_9ASCO|nr:uncharacterized protein KQ657_000949 [Scheffersomyces spartinae]KAG7193192.1 hypothetical protein KQ657_000949 [Scheffersomyces spartinae]
MSQSLIVFRTSGKVEYQHNNKVHAFNEFIGTIVNETAVELDSNFFTNTVNRKKFYAFQNSEHDTYVALYFDGVVTLDGNKVKSTLQSILKTFNKYEEEEINMEKFKSLADLQFNQLMKTKTTSIGEDINSNSSTPLGGAPRSGAPNPLTPTTTDKRKTAPGKKLRKWNGDEIDDSDGKILDYSNDAPEKVESANSNSNSNPNLLSTLTVDQGAFTKENELVLVKELNELLEDEEYESDEEKTVETSKFGSIFSKFSSYFTGTVNLDEVSKKFYDQLVSKNIAPQTATSIISRIKEKLQSKSNITLTLYRQTLIDELTKILTPNVGTDLLYDIKKNKLGRPYVISVVGVNGVGKSTNLAKLSYWLLQNHLNVLICACDTFRSGAVEQLKVHVNNLQQLNNVESTKIDIFEKGYGGGDHVVQTAKLAIEFAGNNGFDVVLIDTAGRTHSNAKLMAPLKKFGEAADPNKIIMVGEALVGSDSVEQAINFNNAFGSKRKLDFFIISKVDTVGDLVGTMINMVMATKVPILFVGTGQTYTDIKRLSVKSVVNLLMK